MYDVSALGFGDNVVDKYEHIKTMYPGGNCVNFAVYAKMFGIEAGYLGVFGDDEAAIHVYNTAHELRLDLSHCRFHTGTVYGFSCSDTAFSHVFLLSLTAFLFHGYCSAFL